MDDAGPTNRLAVPASSAHLISDESHTAPGTREERCRVAVSGYCFRDFGRARAAGACLLVLDRCGEPVRLFLNLTRSDGWGLFRSGAQACG